MAEDNIEEETYSLIFTSLKHPIRRRILRMLADKPLTYSEILETLNIDSGHLSYHLENLGDLTVHSNNGQYQLSSFGEAAVKLMGGVEEQSPVSSHRRFKLRRLFAKVYPVILVLALIGASCHLVTYATVVSTDANSTENLLFPRQYNIPFNVSVGETFEIDVTIKQGTSLYGHGFVVHEGVQEWTFSIPQLESTITGWDEATIWLDSIVNFTTILISYNDQVLPVTVWNETTQTNETITITVQGSGLSVNPFDESDPSSLELKIFTPEGTVLTETFYRTRYMNRIDTSMSPPVAITQTGTYTFKITNRGSRDWNGLLTANLQVQHFEKPFFYWGIVGFAIALGYVGLVTATAYKTRHSVEKK